MARFQKSDLEAKYGITGTTEVLYNPSYEVLFNEETKPELTGYEKGQVSRTRRGERHDGYLYRSFAQGQVHR